MASTKFAEIFAQEMRLKAVRERRDIDQLTVAEDLGVSPATVSRWKNGSVPEDNTLQRIANYFSVTPGWLRYGQEPREAPATDHDGPVIDALGSKKLTAQQEARASSVAARERQRPSTKPAIAKKAVGRRRPRGRE